MKPAIFIDRDGVIVDESRYPIVRPEDVVLLPGAARAIRRLNDAGLPVIVVTNQAIVARGLATEADLAAVHGRMEALLDSEAGARVDAIYYCPHHPNPEQESRVSAYCIACDCRKPQPGLILRAAAEMGIDLSISHLIGDSSTDVESGRRAGVKTILLTDSGKCGADGKACAEPDMRAPTLLAAVEMLLESGKG